MLKAILFDLDGTLINTEHAFYLSFKDVLGEQEAQKLFNELYKKKPISKYQTVKIKEIQQGGDTSKYAFELTDGYCIETVCIKRKTGTTVCVSTMVGCPVGCIFCESGSNGFIRNLTPSEIVQQVVLLKEKVNRIVYMGMGEPLFNYNSLIKSIHILRDRNGYNFPTDGITVSTVGPLTQLKKLREEHLKIQLTLSLHATNQTTRNKVIPHMSGNKIEECRCRQASTLFISWFIYRNIKTGYYTFQRKCRFWKRILFDRHQTTSCRVSKEEGRA